MLVQATENVVVGHIWAAGRCLPIPVLGHLVGLSAKQFMNMECVAFQSAIWNAYVAPKWLLVRWESAGAGSNPLGRYLLGCFGEWKLRKHWFICYVTQRNWLYGRKKISLAGSFVEHECKWFESSRIGRIGKELLCYNTIFVQMMKALCLFETFNLISRRSAMSDRNFLNEPKLMSLS